MKLSSCTEPRSLTFFYILILLENVHVALGSPVTIRTNISLRHLKLPPGVSDAPSPAEGITNPFSNPLGALPPAYDPFVGTRRMEKLRTCGDPLPLCGWMARLRGWVQKEGGTVELALRSSYTIYQGLLLQCNLPPTSALPMPMMNTSAEVSTSSGILGRARVLSLGGIPNPFSGPPGLFPGLRWPREDTFNNALSSATYGVRDAGLT
ncbi:hypothetical protein BC629DRAFT_1437040 [Irpex lacteus]|nr:hypothetical protein BC629DRAFT_1437040 [Irpex lacteus]